MDIKTNNTVIYHGGIRLVGCSWIIIYIGKCVRSSDVSDTVNQMFREAYERNPSHKQIRCITKSEICLLDKLCHENMGLCHIWITQSARKSCIVIHRTPSLDILIQLTTLLAQVSECGWIYWVVWSHIQKRLANLFGIDYSECGYDYYPCCLSLTRDTSGRDYGPIITHFCEGEGFSLGISGIHRPP